MCRCACVLAVWLRPICLQRAARRCSRSASAWQGKALAEALWLHIDIGSACMALQCSAHCNDRCDDCLCKVAEDIRRATQSDLEICKHEQEATAQEHADKSANLAGGPHRPLCRSALGLPETIRHNASHRLFVKRGSLAAILIVITSGYRFALIVVLVESLGGMSTSVAMHIDLVSVARLPTFACFGLAMSQNVC